VLEAALAYADAHGLDALSMHKLGAELGVKGMSLYNHVQGKDGLLDGIVELLWSELDADPAASGDWRAAIRSLTASLRDLVHRHPNAAPLLMSRQVMPEPALRICDAYLNVMVDGGVPEECAVGLLRTAFAYGFGYALAELSCLPAGPRPGEGDDLQRFRRMSTLIPNDVPDHLMRVALKVCGDCDMSVQFTIGIDLMIRGLDGYLAETARDESVST
jgi:AcrR family transcriptional regulator